MSFFFFFSTAGEGGVPGIAQMKSRGIIGEACSLMGNRANGQFHTFLCKLIAEVRSGEARFGIFHNLNSFVANGVPQRFPVLKCFLFKTIIEIRAIAHELAPGTAWGLTPVTAFLSSGTRLPADEQLARRQGMGNKKWIVFPLKCRRWP